MAKRCWICRILMASSSFWNRTFVYLTEYVAATHPRTLSFLLSVSFMTHTLDLEKHHEHASSFPQHKLQWGFHLSKQWMRKKNISGTRRWDHSDGGGDRSQETCLHVLTKQNQTREATEHGMKQSRRRSWPTIHLSFHRKVPSHEKALAETRARPTQRQENHFGHWGHIKWGCLEPAHLVAGSICSMLQEKINECRNGRHKIGSGGAVFFWILLREGH